MAWGRGCRPSLPSGAGVDDSESEGETSVGFGHVRSRVRELARERVIRVSIYESPIADLSGERAL